MAKETKKDKKDSKTEIPSAPPVFDVSKPGESAPSSSSRPLIVGHKSMVKNDPMMSENDDKEKAETKSTPITHKREANIKPLTEDSKNTQEVETNKPEKIDEESNKPDDSPSEITASDDSKKQESKNPQTSEASAIDTLAGEASAKREKQKAEEEADKKKAEVEALIASKKYFLPIHDNVYSRPGFFHWFVNFLLIVLVIGAGVILAIDAGYLDIDFALPFDLIKE